jgi:hypothetical protein
VNHWEVLAFDFRHAVEEGVNERAADILAEFALGAPASMVRRYHESLVEASAGCADLQVRDHFLSTRELVRQRASMTRSSLVLLPHTFEVPGADARMAIQGGK